jgi:NitT/TauT family transport system substrate-binding protein
MSMLQNRRRFLTGLSWAAVGLAGLPGRATVAEPPPETTTIRIAAYPSACTVPLYMAEELLHEEGFVEVRYVPVTFTSTQFVDGDVDFDMQASVNYLPLIDAGRPLKVLAGVHVGCYELRANDSIQGITDLRGKRVGIRSFGSTDHFLVSLMASYVGLDPAADINWVTNPTVTQAELFTAGKVDAFIGNPPKPGQPCARNVGHVVVNIAHDRPWSNYFCCMVIANAGFVRNNPVATKRALRAILKATDICHREPERAAQRMAERGFSAECARMILSDARYGLWRDYDPEDSVRFFTLRLHELGMIKKTPDKVISGFTDWRFLKEIKRELT